MVPPLPKPAGPGYQPNRKRSSEEVEVLGSEERSGGARELLLVLGLVPADLLSSELQFAGDLLLCHALSAGIPDRLAKGKPRCLNLLARCDVGGPRRDNS